MSKLKLSLICVFAALLCCAFAAFIGIYAYNASQNDTISNTETSAEISRPEHEATATATERPVITDGFTGTVTRIDGDTTAVQYNLKDPYTYNGYTYYKTIEVQYTGSEIFVGMHSSSITYPGGRASGTTYTMIYNSNNQPLGFGVKVQGKSTYTTTVTLEQYTPSQELTYLPTFYDGSTQMTFTVIVKDMGTAISPTVSCATTMTYGGTQTLSVNGNTGGGDVKWTLTNGSGTATLSSTTAAAPTLTAGTPGTVTVYATVAAKGNYLAGTTPTVTITIGKAGQTVSISGGTSVQVDKSITLTGSGAKTTASWSSSDTSVATVSGGVVTGKKVGTVTITYSAPANTYYNAGSDTKTITVTKGDQTLSIGGNNSVQVDKTLNLSGSGSVSGATVSWSSSDTSVATVSSSGVVTGKKVGSVTITYSATATTNYNAGSATKTISVTKGDQTLSIGGGNSVAVDGTLNLSGSGSVSGATVSWSSSDTSVATVSSSGVVTGKKVGSVTITYSATATTNYNAGSATKTISVTKGSQAALTITGATSVVYGSTLSLTAGGGSGTGAYSWTSSDPNVATVNSSGVVTPVKQGTVTITLNKALDTNYNAATAKTHSVTVQRKAVAIPTLSLGAGVHSDATASGQSATTTYNGNAQHVTLSATPSEITFGTATSGATRSGTDFYATNAGSYSVAMTIDGDKYCWGATNGGSDVAAKALSLNIGRAAISPTLQYGSDNQIIFSDGVNPTVGENPGNGTPSFTVAPVSGTATVNATTGYLTGTNVGTVLVTVNIAQSTNYAAGSAQATVTVNPKDLANVTVNQPSAMTYTGDALTPDVNIVNGTLTLVKDTDYTLAYRNNVNAGTAQITITGTGNYKGTATTSLVINKAPLSLTLTYGTVTYGTDSDAPTYTGNSGNGTVTFSVEDGTGQATITPATGVITPVFPGTVTAKISVEETANYLAGEATATVDIKKITPTADANIMEGYYYVGDTLKSILISVGNSSTSGEVTWTDRTTVIAGLSGEYGWTFTPDETDYYEVITGTMPVTAYYKLTGITVANPQTMYSAYDTFDTEGVVVTASYATGKADTVVTDYTVIYPTAGLTHFIVNDDGKYVTVSYSENGKTATQQVQVFIIKSDYDMSDVSMENLTVTYDEDIHSITYSGTLPKGVFLDHYTYNGEVANYAVNAGTYTVEAVFRISDTANYNVPQLSATLTINKATPTASASVMEGYYYVGDKLGSAVISVGDSSVPGTVAWTNGNSVITSLSGTYSWTFTPADSNNYNTAKGTAQVTAYHKLTGIKVANPQTMYKAYESFETAGMVVTASYAAGKVDTAVTGYTLIYPTPGLNYFVITDDYKDLTISYTENGITVTATVTIIIDANEYDMSGVSMGNATVVYDTEYHTLTYTGTLPDGVHVVGYKYDGELNALGVKNAGIYTVEAVFEIDDTENYKYPKLSATLTISKATPTASASVVDTYYYIGDALNGIKISVGDSSVPGTIKWTNPSTQIMGTAGNYGWTFTPQDTANYKQITGSVPITAYHKVTGITVSNPQTTYKAYETFETTGMVVTASYLAGKSDTVVTNYTFTYPTEGLSHFITADDGRDVIISYTEGGLTVTAKVTITIDANSYNMSGVTMENLTVPYDGNFHSITYTGTLPKEVRVIGYKYNGEGSDGAQQAGTYLVEAIFDIDDPDNYKPPRLSATLTISKADPTDVTANVAGGYHYVGDTLGSVTISVGNSSVSGTIKWTNESALITGVANSYGWTFTPDDSVNYNNVTGTAQVTAYHKLTGISVSGAQTNYKPYDNFTTTGMTVVASYAMGKPDTVVNDYFVTYPTAGATYFVISDDGKNVTITYMENGKTATATVTITIDAKEYNMSGVSLSNSTVVYDKEYHTLTYTGTLPAGVTLKGYNFNGEFSTEGVKNVGIYTVEAVFEIDDPENYKMPKLSAILVINKATPTATANVVSGYYYVGDTLESVKISVADSSVPGTVTWTNTGATITGVANSYGWTFTPNDTDNYKTITGTAEVTAYYKLTGITVTGAKTEYRAHESFDTTGLSVVASYATGKPNTAVTDYYVTYPTAGLTHFIVKDDGKSVTITYTENGKTATAEVTVSIIANEYDMSGVTMDNLTVDYDNNFHTLTFKGELPEGVTVTGYKYNGEESAVGVKSVGTYTVEAIFEIDDPDNYKMPKLSATLKINKATPTVTASILNAYSYVGDKLSSLTISATESSTAGTIKWTNENAIITGTSGTYGWTFVPDDLTNYKQVTGSVQVTACYKLTGITVTGAKTVYNARESFDTTGMTVTASYAAGKIDTAVSDYFISYPTAGATYFVIADDGKDVTITYMENGKTATATVTITINANQYDMTGVSLDNATLPYDGEFHMLTHKGDLPAEVRIVGYTFNGEFSAHGVKDAGTYLVEAVFEIDDAENYKVPKLSATLVITKATPTATAQVLDVYYYVGDELNSVKISVGESSVPGKVSWINADATITGTSGTYGWKFTPDDTVNYNPITGTADVTAYYKLSGITVTGAKNTYKTYDSFDPTGMTVTASYAVGKVDTVVNNYFIVYPTAGLTHFIISDDGKDVTITYMENGLTATATVTIIIDANEYEMSGVSMDDVTVDYDNNFHTLTLTGELPEGVHLLGYKYNGELSAEGVKTAGTYTVEAVFSIDDPDNYRMPKLSATLKINKATPTATAKVMTKNNYVGDELSSVEIAVNTSSVPGTVKWTNESALVTGTVGRYGWTFTPDDTDNYKEITGTLQVTAYHKLKALTVIGAKGFYKPFETFDTTGMMVVASYEAGKANTVVSNYTITYPTAGLDHFVITDDSEYLTITYTENGITVTAQILITIDALEYNMSGVSMDDVTVEYDKEYHTLTLTGNLPEGVHLLGYKYNGEESEDGVKNAGTYKVEAVFKVDDPENYKVPKLSATLKINKATPTATANILSNYYYVGDELKGVIIDVSTSSVPGTISWTNKNALITGLSNSYSWTFTPNDSDNYNEIMGTSQVTAYYKLTGITVTGAKTEYKPYGTFDPTGMTVTASYAIGKLDTVVSDYTVTYPTAGLTHFVISDDGENLTISYYENGITVTATVTISIDANKYEMTGVGIGNLAVDYDGDYHTVTLTGNLPEGVHLLGFKYDGTESAQGVKEVGSYQVEAIFKIDDPDNYKMPKLSATLVISKADPQVTPSIADGYYYVGDTLEGVKITVGSGNVEGTISWINESALITGENNSYGWTFTPKDTDSYNVIQGTVQVVAYYKLSGITVTGAKSTYKTYETFDTAGMTVTASYEADKADTVVSNYFITYPTEGLTHFVISDDGKNVTISYTEGGKTVSATVAITIEANEYDMSGASMDDLTVTYAEGVYRTITLTGDLPEGVHLLGYKYNGEENDGGVNNAGTYTVEAVFSIDDPNNYKMPKLSATLTINKATPDVTVEIISNYSYVGDTLSSVSLSLDECDVEGLLGWTNENALITGVADSYGWTFTPNDTDNYNVVTGRVQVDAYYKLTGITVTGAKNTYNSYESFETAGLVVTASYAVGKTDTRVTDYTLIYPTEGLTHFVISDDGKDLIISYTENGKTATANVTIVIDALEYDMTGVSMDDLTVTYDGALYAITLTGDLPDGVHLTGYKYNGENNSVGVKNAGTYTVEAVFTVDDPENYKMPKLSATLVIDKATPTATAKVFNVYYYVGEDLSSVKITVDNSSVPGTVKWTDASTVIEGTTGTYGWTFVPSDSVNYNEITGTASVTAYYKLSGLTVTGAKDTYKPFDTFDTTGMVVTASYETGKADTVVEDYYITYPTNGLTHFIITDDGKNLTVTYLENGVTASATVTITIEAKEYDMTGVSMDDVTVTYDGNYHTLTLTGDLPEGVHLLGYKYNGEESATGVNTAGTYTVEAVFEVDDPDNYKVPRLSATLTINKAKPTATVNVADGTYFVGDGLDSVSITLNTSSVPGTVKWTNQNALIMGVTGSYGWTFVPDDSENYDNYKGIVQIRANYKLASLTVLDANDFYAPYASFDPAGMTVIASYEVGKADVVVTDYSITYPTEGLNYFIITDDGKDLIISYTENGITVTANVTIVIDALEYNMTGVSMDDATVTYDGNYHSLSLTGELPAGVHLLGYKYNGEESEDGVKNAGTYKVEAVFEVDEPDTYKVPRLSATLTINKATTTATAKVVEGIYFVGDALSTVEIEVDESSVPGKVSWTNPEGLINGASGNYGWTFTPDDAENYGTSSGVVRVTASFKLAGLTVTGAKNVYKPNESFDATGMTVIASYAAGKTNTIVRSYTLTYPTEGLTRFVISDDGKDLIISYTENGITVTAGVTIVIDAYEYNMSGVSMDDATVTYDGNFHTITLTGNLPEGVHLLGYKYNGEESDDGVKNAGTYKVEAVFGIDEPDTYKVPKLSATLVINKAAPTLNVSGVQTVYVYDGTLQTVSGVATVNNSEQTVVYSDNTFTTVAEGNGKVVTISVAESDNYLAASTTVTLTVNKATPVINVSGVQTVYVYDGTLQKVESGATVNNSEQTVLYSNNQFTTVAEGNALKVNIYVQESANYLAASEELEITVDKAHVSGVTFTDKTVTYDGGNQTITLDGTLTGDVTVVYYYENTTNVFGGETDVKYVDGIVTGYRVTAHFVASDNYYAPDDITATLTIQPYEVTGDNVSNIDDEYGYNGKPWKPQPVITVPLADGDFTLNAGDYTVTYSTEDYVLGTHVTVTITVDLGGNIVGTVEKEFVIVKGTLGVIWNEGDFVYNGTQQGVTVEGLSGLAADDEGLFDYTVKYVGLGDTVYESDELPVNAGRYAAVVTIDDAVYENYKVADEDSLVNHFEIAKADIEVSVELAPHGTLHEGAVLPELRVIGTATSGSMTVNGTAAWQQIEGKYLALELHTHEYTWVFTPEDSLNFNAASGTFTLTAVLTTLKGIKVEWRDDTEINAIYTSTTLSEVRHYLKVTGTLSDDNEIEIAGYDMKGDWGYTPNPSTASVGDHVLTVSYKGYEDTIIVYYQPISIEKIWVEAATADGITKTYLGLQEFARNSIIVNVRFSDGTVKENVTDYTVIYEGGHSALWAGDEKVTISYNGVTCEIDGLNVVKKVYDMDGITFEDVSVDYDGEVKSYELGGDFKAGTVSYTYAKLSDGGEWETVSAASVKNAGTYRVTVKFLLVGEINEANYEEVTSQEIQLIIKKVDYEKVEEIGFEFTDTDYDYGKSLADKMTVSGLPEGVTAVYEYKYEDGTTLTAEEVINAGKYTVTVRFEGDENHFDIRPITTEFTVKKIIPAVDPSIGGNIAKGTLLKELSFMDSLGEAAGTFEWINGEQELRSGINRCYYVFTPEDTVNYETVKGYIDLPVNVGSANGSGVSDWSIIALVGITALSIVLAMCAIVAVGKKRKSVGDDDGFYDEVTEADLQ